VKLLGRKQVELMIILVLQASARWPVGSEIVRLWFDCVCCALVAFHWYAR
jgi:hypothetical protein